MTNRFERNGDSATVEPKAMQVLVVLAETPGEIVAKEDLLDRVWEGRFVTDDVLIGAIGQLRRALGDDARAPRFIQTVPRHGYRVIAEVASIDDRDPSDEAVEIVDTTPDEARQFDRPTSRWSIPAMLAAAISIAVVAWSARAVWDDAIADRASATDPSVAMVVTEEIELHLAGPPDQDRHPDALVAYQRARLLMKEESVDVTKILDDLRHAIELDPGFAEAWVLLARAHRASQAFGFPVDVALAEARRAASKALDLDARSVDAHVVLGQTVLFLERDVAGAEVYFDRALELDPNHAEAYRARALARAASGRFADALLDAREALRLDPAREPSGWNARLRFLAGERESAIDDLKELLAARPETCFLRRELIELLRSEGRDAEAWAETRTLYDKLGDRELLALLADAHRQGGMEAADRALLTALVHRREAGIELPRPILIAETAALLGDGDLVFEELEQRIRAGDPETLFLRTRPSFESLHGDPRYSELLARLGLADVG